MTFLHPATRRHVLASTPASAPLVEQAVRTARAFSVEERLRDVVPLPGGAHSVVFSALLGPDRVVVKVPFAASSAVEAIGLSWLAPCGLLPALLAERPGVLVLEFLEGLPVLESDAAATRYALEALYSLDRSRPLPSGLPSWWEKEECIFESQAALLVALYPSWASFVASARTGLSLLRGQTESFTLLHADVRGKNLLQTASGIRLLDPWTTLGPLAWELVQALCSATVSGGDPSPILALRREWGISDEEFLLWLRVGIVHHAGGIRGPVLPSVQAALMALLPLPSPRSTSGAALPSPVRH